MDDRDQVWMAEVLGRTKELVDQSVGVVPPLPCETEIGYVARLFMRSAMLATEEIPYMRPEED